MTNALVTSILDKYKKAKKIKGNEASIILRTYKEIKSSLKKHLENLKEIFQKNLSKFIYSNELPKKNEILMIYENLNALKKAYDITIKNHLTRTGSELKKF